MVILQIPFAFVLGLLLGYVAVRWSLRAAIALHIAVNGLSTLISAIENDVFIGIAGLLMFACVVVTLALAIAWRNALKTRIRAGSAYYANTYAYGFSSVSFWIFIAATTGFAVVQLLGII